MPEVIVIVEGGVVGCTISTKDVTVPLTAVVTVVVKGTVPEVTVTVAGTTAGWTISTIEVRMPSIR